MTIGDWIILYVALAFVAFTVLAIFVRHPNQTTVEWKRSLWLAVWWPFTLLCVVFDFFVRIFRLIRAALYG